jgi:hypothetical protein
VGFFVGFLCEYADDHGEDCEEYYGPLGSAPGFSDGDEGADDLQRPLVCLWEETGRRLVTLTPAQGRE